MVEIKRFIILCGLLLLVVFIAQPLSAETGEGNRPDPVDRFKIDQPVFIEGGFAEGSPSYESLVELLSNYDGPVVKRAPRDRTALAQVQQATDPPLFAFPNPIPNPVGDPQDSDYVPNDGGFVDITLGLATLGDPDPNEVVSLSLSVPAAYDEFTLTVFDGDMGGKWDRFNVNFDQVEYELYKDPDAEASTDPGDLLSTWDGGSMSDDEWCDLADTTGSQVGSVQCSDTPGSTASVIEQDASTCPNYPNGVCIYHFVANWINPLYTDQSNFIKVASDGQVFLLAGSTIGFQGTDADFNSCEISDPPTVDLNAFVQCLEDSRTEYDGKFSFNFFVPPPVGPGIGGIGQPVVIDLFDADFDHRGDTNDSNTPSVDCRDVQLDYTYSDTFLNPTGPYTQTAYRNNQSLPDGCKIEKLNEDTQLFEEVAYPPFVQSPVTRAEDALPGAPMDDYDDGSLGFWTISPNIQYKVTTPDSTTVTNDDTSGNFEWEMFRIAKQGENVPDPDTEVSDLPIGSYTWDLEGVDAWNNIFINTNYDLVPTSPVCDLEIIKTCETDINSGTACEIPYEGGDVSYTYEIKNNGSSTYNNVFVNDTHLGLINNTAITLGPGASQTLSGGPVTLTELTTNIATISGIDQGSGEPCVAQSSATAIPTQACLLIIDEDGIDNGHSSAQNAAPEYGGGVTDATIVNDSGKRDDRLPSIGNIDVPTEVGNPFFQWNNLVQSSGDHDIIKVTTGQRDDEGWFALPPEITSPSLPFNTTHGYYPFGSNILKNTVETSAEFLAAFGYGVIPQNQLDPVDNVHPLRNQDLVNLVGRTCTAVVYDSDISMNYLTQQASLQDERMGLFSFTVLAVEVPGDMPDANCTSTSFVANGNVVATDGEWPCELPESKSSTSLYDLWLRVEDPIDPGQGYYVQPRDHEPDTAQMNTHEYSSGTLTIEADSDFPAQSDCSYLPFTSQYPWNPLSIDPNINQACMTTSVDGPDLGGDPNVDPSVFEQQMTWNGSEWVYTDSIAENLDGRRAMISTDEGGSYNKGINQ